MALPTWPHNGLGGWPVRLAVPRMWNLGTKRPWSVSVTLRGHVSCIEEPDPEADKHRAQDEGQSGPRETEKVPLVPSENIPGFCGGEPCIFPIISSFSLELV